MPDGKPGCVMVVADFTAVFPGNEAIIVLRDTGDSMRYEALVRNNGIVERRSVSTLAGDLPYDAAGAGMIAQMQAAPPIVTPAQLNQIAVGS